MGEIGEIALLVLSFGLVIGVVVFAVGWLTNWIFKTYLPQAFRTPALFSVGFIFLIIGLLGV
jgi:F0F1-type ATP synthase membrane subunit c/vacuolar-type H+-ATPase subunit K